MSKGNKIIKKICPNLRINSGRYDKCIDDEFKTERNTQRGKPAIEKLFHNLIKNGQLFSLKKFWLTGSPSMGKSTSLIQIQKIFIAEGIEYFYFNLREVNNHEGQPLVEIYEKIKSANDDNQGKHIKVIILDSYDEIYSSEKRETINALIKQINKPLIVAGRTNEDTNKLFNEFVKIELLEFIDSEIKEILADTITGIPDKIIDIISNTMRLKLFIELYKEADEEKKRQLLTLDNESELLVSYFYKLYEEKSRDGENLSPIKDLADIGKYLFPSNEEKELIEIDSRIKRIFYNVDGQIDAIHQEYIDFACGIYLAQQILDPSSDTSKILDVNLDLEQRRMLVSAGNCLKILGKNGKAEEAFERLNKSFPKDQKRNYANLIQIWCTFRNGKLEDTSYFEIKEVEFILRKAFVQDCIEVCVPVKKTWFPEYYKLLINNGRKFLIRNCFCSSTFYEYFWWISKDSSNDRIKKKKEAKKLIITNKAIVKTKSWLPWNEDEYNPFKVGSFLIMSIGLILGFFGFFGHGFFWHDIVSNFNESLDSLFQIDVYKTTFSIWETLGLCLRNVLALCFYYIPVLVVFLIFLILCTVPYAILQVYFKKTLKKFIKYNTSHYPFITYGKLRFCDDSAGPLDKIAFFPSLNSSESSKLHKLIIETVCNETQREELKHSTEGLSLIDELPFWTNFWNWESELEWEFITSGKNLTLPEFIDTIDSFVFFRFKRITNWASSIGKEAFSFCRNLKRVSFKSNKVRFQGESFSGCRNLKKVILSKKSSVVFGKNEFVDCLKLTKIRMPEHVAMDKNTFTGSHFKKLYLSKKCGYTSVDLYEKYGLPTTCKVIYK